MFTYQTQKYISYSFIIHRNPNQFKELYIYVQRISDSHQRKRQKCDPLPLHTSLSSQAPTTISHQTQNYSVRAKSPSSSIEFTSLYLLSI